MSRVCVLLGICAVVAGCSPATDRNDGASSTPDSQLAISPSQPDAEAALRIVPHVGGYHRGILSSDGGLSVSGIREYLCRSVRLLDRAGTLLWRIPVYGAQDAAFSPDGGLLVVCGYEELLLINVKECRVQRLPLRYVRVRFLPDGKSMLLARGTGSRLMDDDRPGEVLHLDLAGNELRRYPVKMSGVGSIEITAGGKAVRVEGSHGDPANHLRRMGNATETIDLVAGKTVVDWGPLTFGDVKMPPDPRIVALPKPDERIRANITSRGVWVDAASAVGVYRGELRTAIWDLRGARLLSNTRRAEIYGFTNSTTIAASEWDEEGKGLQLVDVRTGRVSQQTDLICRLHMMPGPNLRQMLVGQYDGKEWRTELRDVPDGKPKYTQPYQIRESLTRWSSDGKTLLLWRDGEVRFVDTADGTFTDVSLSKLAMSAKPGYDLTKANCAAITDDGMHALVGVYAPREERESAKWSLIAIDRSQGTAKFVVEEVNGAAGALAFVGPDRVLTGGYLQVDLLDLKSGKNIWSTDTGRSVLQFDYRTGSPYAVCMTQFLGGTVLRLSDGQVVHRSPELNRSSTSFGSIWTHPPIIGTRWAVECDEESAQIRLIDLVRRRTALSYQMFPDGEWIVFTPEGAWDGSPRVHEWTNFCRKLTKVSAAEAETFRDRAKIDAVAREAFPLRKP